MYSEGAAFSLGCQTARAVLQKLKLCRKFSTRGKVMAGRHTPVSLMKRDILNDEAQLEEKRRKEEMKAFMLNKHKTDCPCDACQENAAVISAMEKEHHACALPVADYQFFAPVMLEYKIRSGQGE
jgi:Tfp pilus assembly protein PilP